MLLVVGWMMVRLVAIVFYLYLLCLVPLSPHVGFFCIVPLLLSSCFMVAQLSSFYLKHDKGGGVGARFILSIYIYIYILLILEETPQKYLVMEYALLWFFCFFPRILGL